MSDPKAFAVAFICVVVGVALGVAASYASMDSLENKPYALKQNGDTLFIPTQVVVKHDTLVVIKTTDSVRVEDTGHYVVWANMKTGESGTTWEHKRAGTEITYDAPGGYYVSPKPARKQRDTIYEHKIIYY